jgi:hypothetical protein
VICGDVNVNYLLESHKKTELNRILQSFNLSSIVNFPTRISPNSSSTIDNFFIDNSLISDYDISPSINGLSDHDGQVLKIQFAQQQLNNQSFSYKRNIKQYTKSDFLLKLSYETWTTVFEGSEANTVFNTFFKHIFEALLL